MALTQFNVKAYQEVIDLYKRLLEESDATTSGKFFELLLENYQNPKNSSKQDSVLIQELEKNIEQLNLIIQDMNIESDKRINYTLGLEEAKIKADADLIDMTSHCQKILDEKNILSVQDASSILKNNQVIINLEPHVQFFVDLVLEEYKTRNRPTTAGEMLKNLFWSYIHKGAGDYLPVVYSTDYVRRTLERFKQKQKQEAENGIGNQ